MKKNTAALAFGSLVVLAGCDQITAMTGGGELASVEVAEAPAEEAPTWVVDLAGEQLASSIRGRRGAVRTFNSDTKYSSVSVDPSTDTGAYFAIKLEGDLPDRFTGQPLAVEFDASSPNDAAIEVQYHNLVENGGSAWKTVALTPELKTYTLSMTVPVEPAPRDIDELRFRFPDQAAVYSFSAVRIRIAD